ncbi:MAG: hypothetical protein IJT94_11265, partial [Oscillibacter sp.]|nr:hypothetical protein [Oscillibacter sp.]
YLASEINSSNNAYPQSGFLCLRGLRQIDAKQSPGCAVTILCGLGIMSLYSFPVWKKREQERTLFIQKADKIRGKTNCSSKWKML